MDGTVAHQPQIGRKQILVRRQDLFQVRRSGFFLAFKGKFDVGLHFETGCPNGIQSGQDGDDGSFVVARGARVEPPLGFERRAGRGKRNYLAVFFD